MEDTGGCPRIVRSDCGTENVVIAGMQCYFRAECTDDHSGEKAHRYGSSPSNQRIEGWWSSFRRSRSNWWINHFKEMVRLGILELGNIFDMKCLWFCYAKVIQKELEQVREHWNSHYIRQSRHDTVAGVPDILYFLPENSGSVDCIVQVPQSKLREMEKECEVDNEDDLYLEYFEHVMATNGWHLPTNEQEAFDLFQALKELQGQ